ncbi:MAG: carbohydrate ABC transporter permease [Chloroflexi bacterium]|nr:carbohydrate ABC transporter permease [Chloroflexota bacterium]
MSQSASAVPVAERLTSRPGRRSVSRVRLGRLVGRVVLYTVLIAFALFMAQPFIWMVLTSLKELHEVHRIPVSWWPDNPLNVANYTQIFTERPFWRYIMNSFVVGIGATISTLIFSTLGGYAFAKLPVPGKEILFTLILATIMLPFEVSAIPLYLIFNKVGLVDTYLGLMAPELVSILGIFLIRQFCETIPSDYLDAARIDGAGEVRVLWAVILPIITPALVTLALIRFIATWNNFLWPLLVTRDETMRTLPLALSFFSGYYGIQYHLLAAAACVSVLPLLILFLVLQRQVVEGVALSGLKG